jgi:hypothetical protein
MFYSCTRYIGTRFDSFVSGVGPLISANECVVCSATLCGTGYRGTMLEKSSVPVHDSAMRESNCGRFLNISSFIFSLQLHMGKRKYQFSDLFVGSCSCQMATDLEKSRSVYFRCQDSWWRLKMQSTGLACPVFIVCSLGPIHEEHSEAQSFF